MKKYILVVLLVWLMSISAPLHAIEISPQELAEAPVIASVEIIPDKIMLDGKEYSKDQLIWDFSNIAFSSSLWLSNSLEPWKLVGEIRYSQKIRESVSSSNNWLGDLRHRSELAKWGVINKWRGPIPLAIGWPVYQTAFLNKELSIENDAPHIAAIFEAMREVEDIIENATGLPVVIYDLNDKKDDTQDFARIRILPYKRTYLKNYYKFLTMPPSGTHLHSDNLDALSTLVGAVPFTTSARAQVDGFFLPDEKNNIRFAACRVLPGLSPKIIKSLTQECILRALGLPELSRISQGSMLGLWNEPQNIRSLILPVDGQGAVDAWTVPETNVLADVDTSAAPPVVGEFDLKVLNILYCSELVAGADKLSAIYLLTKQRTCIQGIKGE